MLTELLIIGCKKQTDLSFYCLFRGDGGKIPKNNQATTVHTNLTMDDLANLAWPIFSP